MNAARATFDFFPVLKRCALASGAVSSTWTRGGQGFGMQPTRKSRKPAGCRIDRKNGQGVPGFTLIELLVVISVIGLVAGLTVGLSGVASGKSKESRIRGDLNRLVTLIENYRAKLGSYPPSPDGLIRNRNDIY